MTSASEQRPPQPRATSAVLFVDDERAILDGVRVALRKEPYEIVTADSPARALEILAKRPIDVVVSDEQMPAMPGSAFLARVRLQYPDTIRIILTGQASLESAIRAINEGEIFRFLTKPCNPVDLAHTIHHALLLKNLSRQSARLVAAAREQRRLIADLEARHPGITTVERTEDGRIVLEDATESVETLLATIRDEIGPA